MRPVMAHHPARRRTARRYAALAAAASMFAAPQPPPSRRTRAPPPPQRPRPPPGCAHFARRSRCSCRRASAASAAAPAAADRTPDAKPRVTNFLAADATRPGVITLHFFHAEGAPVTYFECIGGRARAARQLADDRRRHADPPAAMRRRGPAGRPTRRFAATAPKPDGTLAAGTYSVRTMSCTDRFAAASRGPRAGRLLRVRVADSWEIGGIRPLLCITPPGGRRSCERLRFPRAVAVASRRYRANTRGRVLVEVRVRDRRVRSTTIAVGLGGGGPASALRRSILATGDSMMQGIDGFLADDLGEAARACAATCDRDRDRQGPGVAGLVGRAGLPLPAASHGDGDRRERGLAADRRPRRRGEMRGEQWEDEYVRRVRAMMQTYLRRGDGRVVWLMLPAPSGERQDTDLRGGQPRGAARRRRPRGRHGPAHGPALQPRRLPRACAGAAATSASREPDGVHLNVPGTAIAAEAIVRALR